MKVRQIRKTKPFPKKHTDLVRIDVDQYENGYGVVMHYARVPVVYWLQHYTPRKAVNNVKKATIKFWTDLHASGVPKRSLQDAIEYVKQTYWGGHDSLQNYEPKTIPELFSYKSIDEILEKTFNTKWVPSKGIPSSFNVIIPFDGSFKVVRVWYYKDSEI